MSALRSRVDRAGPEFSPPICGPDLAPFPTMPFRLLGSGALSSSAVAAVSSAGGDTGAGVHSVAPHPRTPAPVHLSEAEQFLLRLFAIRDRTAERDALTRAIVAYAKQIGLSPLLRKHFEDSS